MRLLVVRASGDEWRARAPVVRGRQRRADGYLHFIMLITFPNSLGLRAPRLRASLQPFFRLNIN